MAQTAKILIVCTGNICRSPVVEGVIQDRLTKMGYSSWIVESAGTRPMVGREASRYSVIVLNEREGIDISQHRARLVTSEMVADADLVLVMEAEHAEILRIENASAFEKIHLLSELIYKQHDISDPYGLDKDQYEVMVRLVTEIVDLGLDNLIRMAKADGGLPAG